MKVCNALAVTFLVACILSTPVRAQFTEIVAFGDSLTDTGNIYAATNGSFPPPGVYHQGRFCNGLLWVEWLAMQLGVPAPRPFLQGGTNYAFGGAETSIAGLSSRGMPNIGTQIGFYLDAHGTFTNDQLIVLWGGANDFLNAEQTNPAIPVANLSAEIKMLAAAGATMIVIPNMPPLGQTPRYVSDDFKEALDDLAIEFNNLLDAELDVLENQLGITFIRLDTFSVFQRFLKQPKAFGFSNVTETALLSLNGEVGLGEVVANPDQYLFWDAVHPTRITHRELGDLRNYIRYWGHDNGGLKWTPIPTASKKGGS